MKNRYPYLLLLLCCTPLAAQQQPSVKSTLITGDRIESTSYNDHKRGTQRTLQYRPDGTDFVCLNGKNRYTRALYGGPTEWRLETSDRPIFATYTKQLCRNIRFRLHLPDGTTTPLEETGQCEARYTPGKRSYRLTDPHWGEEAVLEISVLAHPVREAAIWEFRGDLPSGAVLEGIVTPIRQPKLSRNGDMGADPPGCFDPAGEETVVQRLKHPCPTDGTCYILMEENCLSVLTDDTPFREAEEARQTLAGRIRFHTPDTYLNTLGGTLSVAADGIWGTEGVWLHGAVGWRMPLSGWRAAYTGDVLGWHDRARTHFDNYAASQVTEVPCTIPHPAQDSVRALARSVKQWGTPQYSNGYICRNPRRNNQMHHYDMNLCYIDELLWHLCWTGDLEYARSIWPVLTRHLAWEKLNFDPDNDGLYDAYACIWASDALYYNSGAVTHSSAYNYRANRMAALIAEKIGEDPAPYREEAERILQALNERLWLPQEGHWAEFQDFMGHRRLHKSAALWTIYHAIDSDTGNPFQSWLATRYIDREIPHIPVTAEGVPEGLATLSTTNWFPYSWSINNVAFGEVMHTALAYFQAGRGEEGYRLLKSAVLDGMYLGESPGNFGQISFYDAARGECYRDFGDVIGIAARTFIQGLYGILPDALNGRLLIRPGFPLTWEEAALHTPDINFDFRSGATLNGPLSSRDCSRYVITHRLPAVQTLALQIPARRSQVAQVTVNGNPATWQPVEDAIGHPAILLTLPANADVEQVVEIAWEGRLMTDTISADEQLSTGRIRREGAFRFTEWKADNMKWWTQTEEPDAPVTAATPALPFQDVVTERCRPVVMDNSFNAYVTEIFRNAYLSPRSPYTTLQIPVQGIGEWCHPLKSAEIDDSGLRKAVRDGILQTPLGIPFRTPTEGHNIAFTSLWDNYPDSLSIPLEGKASRAFLLLAGSTNHMQCHIENAILRVHYRDGSEERLPLVNPDNWAPIEQLFFEDEHAFNRHAPSLWRLRLKTGEVSNGFGESPEYTGVTREIDGGAALLLEMPLQPDKELDHLTLETLSNEIVAGIMAITLYK